MKEAIFLFLMLLTLAMTNCEPASSDTIENNNSSSTSNREYYQLKVYSFKSTDQINATDKYLKEAYLPGLKRIGIKEVGVFKFKVNEEDTIHKTYVLIPFANMNEFLTLEDKLNRDEEYLKAGSEYINAAHDQAPYDRIESSLLRAFEDMPIMQASALEGSRTERIYELRSYESPTEEYYKNKVDMFNAGGEIKLFDRLGFNAVFYAEVISGAKMPNLLYMTTFPNQTKRDQLWEAFFDSPEWTALKGMSKYKNNVSHADIIFLYPTDYSDY